MAGVRGQRAGEKGQMAGENIQIAGRGVAKRGMYVYHAPALSSFLLFHPPFVTLLEAKPLESKRTHIAQIMKAADQRNKRQGNDEVILPGEVAELHFPEGASLSLAASKMFVQLVQEAMPSITEDKEHTIPLAMLNKAHKGGGWVETAVRELQRTIIEIDVKSRKGRQAKRSAPILTEVTREIDTEVGELTYEFSKTFRQIVTNSNHWASIHARAVLAMEGKNTVWLYQLCCLKMRLRECEFTYDLDDLRSRLGANAPSLKRWQEFKRRALEPAIAEIQHITGIDVDYVPVKRARKVIGVTLIIGEKQGEAVEEAKKELNNVRTGRKARRMGMVEKITAEKEELKKAFKR